MLRSVAHLSFAAMCVAAQPADACGAVSSQAVIASVEPSGDIHLADGRVAKLGGLQLVTGAAGVLAAHAGATLGIASLAPRPDRWGREVVDLLDESGNSLAVDLLVRGLAEVVPDFETRSCESERLDAEAAARAAGEGVWATRLASLDAADRNALGAYDGRFAIVSGVVRRVGVGRAKVYLDFGGRGGFSVVVARKAEPAFLRRGLDLKALVGRRVRVRGVVDDRFGPRIEVADPSMIELDEGA